MLLDVQKLLLEGYPVENDGRKIIEKKKMVIGNDRREGKVAHREDSAPRRGVLP